MWYNIPYIFAKGVFFMKTITEKMDYDLFKTFFLEGNSEKMQIIFDTLLHEDAI